MWVDERIQVSNSFCCTWRLGLPRSPCHTSGKGVHRSWTWMKHQNALPGPSFHWCSDWRWDRSEPFTVKSWLQKWQAYCGLSILLYTKCTLGHTLMILSFHHFMRLHGSHPGLRTRSLWTRAGDATPSMACYVAMWISHGDDWWSTIVDSIPLICPWGMETWPTDSSDSFNFPVFSSYFRSKLAHWPIGSSLLYHSTNNAWDAGLKKQHHPYAL